MSDQVVRVPKQMGRPKKVLDVEQRARREVANSNERRRMQCINNGFNCLREILKRHNNIEKQSKASILHESANYIQKLENDINHFAEQNRLLKNYLDVNGKERKSPTASADSGVNSTGEESERTEDESDCGGYLPPKKSKTTLNSGMACDD